MSRPPLVCGSQRISRRIELGEEMTGDVLGRIERQEFLIGAVVVGEDVAAGRGNGV